MTLWPQLPDLELQACVTTVRLICIYYLLSWPPLYMLVIIYTSRLKMILMSFPVHLHFLIDCSTCTFSPIGCCAVVQDAHIVSHSVTTILILQHVWHLMIQYLNCLLCGSWHYIYTPKRQQHSQKAVHYCPQLTLKDDASYAKSSLVVRSVSLDFVFHWYMYLLLPYNWWRFLASVGVWKNPQILCVVGTKSYHILLAGIKLRDLPFSASQMLRLKGCTTMPSVGS